MPAFSIADGNSTTFVDTTPNGGIVIDFARLDNSFSIQVNGVDLFVGGPGIAPNELEFQVSNTPGQTVRFADGDLYGINTQEVWQLSNTTSDPIVRIEINPDGTVQLFGVKVADGPLVPLELFNGLSVNTAAIASAWNATGSNTIVVDQVLTGPTNASGDIIDVTCFASGTLIETAHGAVPIETLKVGDQIRTYDDGVQPIRWLGSCTVSRARLDTQPNLKPVLIRADSLGTGYPKQDLIVSPQHRILVRSAVAKRIFGCTDVLIPAKKLLSLDGIDIQHDNPNGVEYWHMLFDDHHIIWSNGAPSESLFTGLEAMKALPAKSRAEIKELFPEICAPGFQPVSACFIPEKGKLVGKLVQRHQANNKPLYNAM